MSDRGLRHASTDAATGAGDSEIAPGKRARSSAIQRKAAAPPASEPAAARAELDEPLSCDVSFVDSIVGAPVQRKGDGAGAGDVHALAEAGTAGPGGSLPFLDQIQASFGPHDVSGVQAHTGGEAAAAAGGMGATAFATGNHVAFGGAPDLHTTAHEAAHVVQQRAGVHLAGGVGASGDAYEQHADAVADRVVSGESAADLLGAPATGGGGGVQRAVQKREPKAKDKPWLDDPDYQGPLPGVPVDGFDPVQVAHRSGAYTEADRNKLKKALDVRAAENRRRVGVFLHDYVDAAVTIVAKYVMTSVKEKDAMAGFIKFAISESLASLAGGAVGMIASKGVKAALEFLASKGTDFGVSNALDAGDTFDDEKGLGAMIDAVGKDAGQFVEAMVNELGPEEADLNYWLGRAKPADFSRFRIPELFAGPSRDAVRAVVAGVVAGHHHRRPEGGNMLQGIQYVETDTVETGDNNMVDVTAHDRNGTVVPDGALVRSKSDVITKEIRGKTTLGTLPTMALRVALTAEPFAAAGRLLDAIRAPAQSDVGEMEELVTAYPASKEPGGMVFTRNGKGQYATPKGGGFGEHLLMYQWATGDQSLAAIADRMKDDVSDETTKVTTVTQYPAATIGKEIATHIGSKPMANEAAPQIVAGPLARTPVK